MFEQNYLEYLASNNCILKVVAGSHAYGTNIEGSDFDERGIFCDISERVVLPFEKIEQVKLEKEDTVYYELSKYMSLLLTQNPNILELIWTEKEDILFKNEMGDLLINNREHFLSKKVSDTYVGYALSQLKRIKGHNKWLNNPQPIKEPRQEDYISIVWNFTDIKEQNKKISNHNLVAIALNDNHFALWDNDKIKRQPKNWIDNKGNPIIISKEELASYNTKNVSPDLIVKINKNVYNEAHDNWKSYWHWKKNRNEKRSALEEKFGYDVKHAMHLIRLLRSGIDILEKGIVPVKRNDAQYLLDIRFGKYSYEQIIQESEDLKSKVQYLSQRTFLPDMPNMKLAKEIMMEIYNNIWTNSLKLGKAKKL